MRSNAQLKKRLNAMRVRKAYLFRLMKGGSFFAGVDYLEAVRYETKPAAAPLELKAPLVTLKKR